MAERTVALLITKLVEQCGSHLATAVKITKDVVALRRCVHWGGLCVGWYLQIAASLSLPVALSSEISAAPTGAEGSSGAADIRSCASCWPPREYVGWDQRWTGLGAISDETESRQAGELVQGAHYPRSVVSNAWAAGSGRSTFLDPSTRAH